MAGGDMDVLLGRCSEDGDGSIVEAIFVFVVCKGEYGVMYIDVEGGEPWCDEVSTSGAPVP